MNKLLNMIKGRKAYIVGGTGVVLGILMLIPALVIPTSILIGILVILAGGGLIAVRAAMKKLEP
jgi:hypothetical protein